MRALLIDDHPLVFADLQGAMNALGGQMSLVVAGSSVAARTVLERDDGFDLIVLDLHAADGDAMGFLAEVRRTCPGVPVVALSSGDVQTSNVEIDSLQMLADIWRHARSNDEDDPSGGTVRVEPEPDAVDWRFRTTAHASLVDLGLTRRQTEVLAFLLEGWSNKAIARELSLSVDTVKDHVTALMRALNVRSRTQAVLAVTRRMRQMHQAHRAHRESLARRGRSGT